MKSYRVDKGKEGSMAKIFIVEDDTNIREIERYALTNSGYQVEEFDSGVELFRRLQEQIPSLILLDIMMPGVDGFTICREIRKNSICPIIFLTARGREEDILYGYQLGCDDYIVKPFDTKELVARVKANLRRCQQMTPVETPKASDAKVVEYPDLLINQSNYSVLYQGRTVEMPPKELELLYFLASSPNQVFTREQLLDHIWGYEYIGDTRTVDVHIKRLREKIKDHPRWSLSTVWGIGYKFETR